MFLDILNILDVDVHSGEFHLKSLFQGILDLFLYFGDDFRDLNAKGANDIQIDNIAFCGLLNIYSFVVFLNLEQLENVIAQTASARKPDYAVAFFYGVAGYAGNGGKGYFDPAEFSAFRNVGRHRQRF